MDIEKLKKKFPCHDCGGEGERHFEECLLCAGHGIDWPAAFMDLENKKQIAVPVPDTIEFKNMVDELTKGIREKDKIIAKYEGAIEEGNNIIAEKNRRIHELEQRCEMYMAERT